MLNSMNWQYRYIIFLLKFHWPNNPVIGNYWNPNNQYWFKDQYHSFSSDLRYSVHLHSKQTWSSLNWPGSCQRTRYATLVVLVVRVSVISWWRWTTLKCSNFVSLLHQLKQFLRSHTSISVCLSSGANIFLSSNGSIKLGDFGLSVQLKNFHKTMPNEIKQQVGTVRKLQL